MSDPHKLLLALAATVAVSLATSASPALAVITGGCTATGSASRSGDVDLATATEWRLRSDDVVNATGRAPREQTAAQASAYAFFVPLSLLVATGRGPLQRVATSLRALDEDEVMARGWNEPSRFPAEAQPDLVFHLKRLERAGFVSEFTGSFLDYGDGVYQITMTFRRLMRHLERHGGPKTEDENARL